VLLAGLRAAEARYPQREGRAKAVLVARHWADRVAAIGLAAGLGIGVLVGGAVAVIAAHRGPQILHYAQANTAFFVVAGALALSALVLLGALTSVISRRA
jgi:zinc transporter ZupT